MVAASRLSLKGGGPRADVQLHDFTCMATSLLIMQLPIILIPYILSLLYALGRPDHAVCWDSLFSFLSGRFLHLLLFFGAQHKAGLLHLPPPSGRVCGRCRHQLASSSQYHSISACNDEYQYDPRGSRRDAFSGTIQPVKALSGHPAPRHPTTGFLCTGSSLDAPSDPHAAEIAWQREAVEKL